ncbi:hypothetical protein CE91St62_30770 [Lachnospiraceae bacterium]|nr:hypothetical protein [Extibacter sp. GGCC_0201]BDF35014.1 hypothetical protein CE91St61_30890 [Lachnospiraceae bacterium]BDF39016.1 hypothetical protein CE91St62_30770 [Lachnospiraceae bacterium]
MKAQWNSRKVRESRNENDIMDARASLLYEKWFVQFLNRERPNLVCGQEQVRADCWKKEQQSKQFKMRPMHLDRPRSYCHEDLAEKPETAANPTFTRQRVSDENI